MYLNAVIVAPDCMQAMLPRTILDRLHERRGRFSGLRLSERDVEEVLRDAASGLDLDLSGASLVEDVPFFIADAIGRNNYFEFVNVDLGGTNLALAGFDVLMGCIVQFRDLESLNVRSNGLPKEAAVALAKALGAKSKLRILDVHDNFLGDSGVAVIAGAFTSDLSHSKHYRSALMSLKVLDLSSNYIGDLGILALCRGFLHFAKHLATIDKTSALVSLRLDRNKLGDKSAICLAQLIRSCHGIGTIHIEELSVCENPIGPEGLSALLAATRRVRPESVDGSVLGSSSGQHIELDENGVLVGGHNELDLALSQLSDSIRQREGASVAPSEGGPITVLRASGCKVDVPVLQELASLLRSGGSQLHTVDLGLSRAAARDLSQQPGFREAILSLNESVARNPIITSLHLGELLEVCSSAAVVLPVGSPESASLRQVVEALNSMDRILRMDNSLQRQMWYAGHYNDISSAGTDTLELLSSASQDHRGSGAALPPSSDVEGAALKKESAPLLVPGIPIEKSELDKIRQNHGSVFSELTQEIRELSEAAQQAQNSAEDVLSSRPRTPGASRSRGGGMGLSRSPMRGRDVTSPFRSSGGSEPTTPYFPHIGFLGETMSSAIRRAQSTGRHRSVKDTSENRSNHNNNATNSSSGSTTGGGDSPSEASANGRADRSTGRADRSREHRKSKHFAASPETEETTGPAKGSSSPRLYDEASVEALVKAAVKSALSVVAGNPPSGGGIGGLEVVPTVPGLPGGSLETPVYSGDTVSTINVAAGNSAHNDLHLIEARLALLEDKMEGVEVVDAIERKKSGPTAASDSSSRDAKDAVIEALLQTVARLEARLEATEARLAQMETEQRSATDGRARDDVAMKEFIVHMEEAHVALAERLAHVESTVEQDSETSIGLLDMLIKKLDR